MSENKLKELMTQMLEPIKDLSSQARLAVIDGIRTETLLDLAQDLDIALVYSDLPNPISLSKMSIEALQKELDDSQENKSDREVVKFDEGTFSYQNDENTPYRLLNAIIQFIKKNHLFSGESIMQTDNGMLESPNLMCDIIDNILKVDVKFDWADEE